MIYLYEGLNDVVLTLNEKLDNYTAYTDYYIFNIINTNTNEEKNMLALDTSSATCRYNSFEVSLTTSASTENLSNSIIYLNNGYYDYNIYPTVLISGSTFSGITNNLLETGKLYADVDINLYRFDDNNDDAINHVSID